MRKNYKKEDWRRHLKEMKVSVRPEDVKDLDKTEPAKKAKKLLEKAPYTTLTTTQYCNVPDYIIASLEMYNGQRPGPFETILLQTMKMSLQFLLLSPSVLRLTSKKQALKLN